MQWEEIYILFFFKENSKAIIVKDQKYWGGEHSKKFQSLNLLHAGKYLHRIYTVLGSIRNIEMI